MTKMNPSEWDKVLNKVIRKNIDVLNKIESHLGCVVCKGPLTDGRCPECQPSK